MGAELATDVEVCIEAAWEELATGAIDEPEDAETPDEPARLDRPDETTPKLETTDDTPEDEAAALDMADDTETETATEEPAKETEDAMETADEWTDESAAEEIFKPDATDEAAPMLDDTAAVDAGADVEPADEAKDDEAELPVPVKLDVEVEVADDTLPPDAATEVPDDTTGAAELN